eukprot:6579902-Lingulodinium_polyedra.AAC.1
MASGLRGRLRGYGTAAVFNSMVQVGAGCRGAGVPGCCGQQAKRNTKRPAPNRLEQTGQHSNLKQSAQTANSHTPRAIYAHLACKQQTRTR